MCAIKLLYEIQPPFHFPPDQRKELKKLLKRASGDKDQFLDDICHDITLFQAKKSTIAKHGKPTTGQLRKKIEKIARDIRYLSEDIENLEYSFERSQLDNIVYFEKETGNNISIDELLNMLENVEGKIKSALSRNPKEIQARIDSIQSDESWNSVLRHMHHRFHLNTIRKITTTIGRPAKEEEIELVRSIVSKYVVHFKTTPDSSRHGKFTDFVSTIFMYIGITGEDGENVYRIVQQALD